MRPFCDARYKYVLEYRTDASMSDASRADVQQRVDADASPLHMICIQFPEQTQADCVSSRLFVLSLGSSHFGTHARTLRHSTLTCAIS